MKKISKYILMVSLSLSSTLSIAQTPSPKDEVLLKIRDIVVFNSKIIGASQYCKLDGAKAKIIADSFQKYFNQLELSQEDGAKIDAAYQSSFSSARLGQGLPNNFTCEGFSKDFEQIYLKAAETLKK